MICTKLQLLFEIYSTQAFLLLLLTLFPQAYMSFSILTLANCPKGHALATNFNHILGVSLNFSLELSNSLNSSLFSDTLADVAAG